MQVLTPEQLAAARTAALAALDAAGVPQERGLLAITNPPDDGDSDGVAYETVVGATHDRDAAVLLSLMAKDLVYATNRAATALVRPENCPACGSPRLAFLQRRRDPPPGGLPGIYVETLDDCLDCDYLEPRR